MFKASSVARGGARGHSHLPNHTWFVLDRNVYYPNQTNYNIIPAYLLFGAPPKLNSWLRHCLKQIKFITEKLRLAKCNFIDFLSTCLLCESAFKETLDKIKTK